jgi:hypothetical protein
MDIHDLLSKKEKLSKLSLKNYELNTKGILNGLNKIDANYFYLEPAHIISYLNTAYTSPNTIKTKIASVIVLLRCMDKSDKVGNAINVYSEEIVKLTEKIKNELATGEKSKNQEKNWLTPEDKIKIEDNLKSKVKSTIKNPQDLLDFRNYIIWLLYKELPTRNDFAETQLIYQPPVYKKVKLDDKMNYIILNKKDKSIKYVLNVYKTSKVYGQKVIDLDSNLYNILNDYKNAKENISDDDALLLNSDATHALTKNRLGVIYSTFGEIVNKKTTTTLNRHQAVSDALPLKDLRKLAGRMSHSVNEALNVYAKK